MDEIEQLGLLVDLSSLKFGKLKTKVKDENGNKTDKDITYRAYQAIEVKSLDIKAGTPIFLGSSLKELSDEKIRAQESDLLVGKVGKNLVVYTSGWVWE